jgi:hypothetical protein
LLDRDRGNGEVAKAVETIIGGDPNIAFTILKETCNGIAGETVRLRKRVRLSLVHMHKPPVQRADPQAAIAIPEQACGIELPPDAWKRIRLYFPVDESSDSAIHSDQERALAAFD